MSMHRSSRIKISVFPKLTCKFNTLATEIPTELFCSLLFFFKFDELILKFIWKIKIILEKNKVRDMPYQLKDYNKTIGIISTHN